MRARSRRALLYEGGQEFFARVSAAVGACGGIFACGMSAQQGRVSDGCERCSDFEDREARRRQVQRKGGRVAKREQAHALDFFRPVVCWFVLGTAMRRTK